MTSIIIPVHNALKYTKLCVESIRKYTNSYEIIIVDNDSSDGTAKWLSTQDDIRYIYNDENRGFPHSVNQGIETSKGETLCILNNDTIVTPNWLEFLIDSMYRSEVGIIGPMTNYCLGKQCISDVPYKDMNGLLKFSHNISIEYKGDIETVDWVIGFCMVFPMELVNSIGFFDEKFGIGNSEDIDFCFTAKSHGYSVAFAKDVFIHHFGNVTHRQIDVDYYHLLSKNTEMLINKHGKKAERFREYNSIFFENSLKNTKLELCHIIDIDNFLLINSV